MQAFEERDRRRRLERSRPEGELVLTERDLAILQSLHDNRFMHTRQLQALYGGRVFRRLARLFDHGYVDRPRAQRIWRQREGGGSRPLVHALSTKGAQALCGLGLIRQTGRDWSERNRDLSPFSFAIPHELAVADVRVAFVRACRDRPGRQLLHGEKLASGRAARALEIPGRDHPLYPDWIAAVDAGSGEPCLFFVEVDRCTEPNTRRGSEELQSLQRKFEGYLAYARARRQREQFGIGNFRVLTITTGSETRVRNMAAAAHKASGGVGAGRFLSASFADLLVHDPLATLPWVDSGGGIVRLWL